MRIPEVLVPHSTVGENHFVFVPDAVAAVWKRGAVATTGSNPLELVVPHLSTAARQLSIPVVGQIRAGTISRSVVEVTNVPSLVPLHLKLVVRVRRRPTEEPIKNTGAPVVAGNLVEPCGSRIAIRENACATSTSSEAGN